METKMRESCSNNSLEPYLVNTENKWDEKKRDYSYKELLTKNDLVEWLKHGMLIGSHGKSHKFTWIKLTTTI